MYDLSRTLDNIRTYYHHVESCQETVPEAIIAFLESKDFEDAIRNAVSLGGDTDTLGAITGSIAEAFYGIPAVLIAECKSRIDKGLMTDVLDEFDHVLGRSVDTYSDEVDETQANQMIEAAIDQYYIQQDKNGMLLFMEVMVTRMQQAGEVIVPYITENPFMSEEQISKVKAGDTISLDHDVRLKIETVKDADEKEWIGVFTSSEEMHKGSAGNVQMNQSIESILRLALNWEQVNGIVINPFGKYIQMTKKMIELLINGYEYNENERKSISSASFTVSILSLTSWSSEIVSPAFTLLICSSDIKGFSVIYGTITSPACCILVTITSINNSIPFLSC